MKKHALTLLLLINNFILSAQETVPTSGGDIIDSGGTANYTVGQPIYTTNNGDGSAIQGIQQSIEVFTLSKPELSTINLTAITYPNPTSDYVTLSIVNNPLNDLSYKLYTLNGQIITSKKIYQKETKIIMKALASGSYILKINKTNIELKSFKIIKN